MTVKNDTKIEEELTCRFKIDIRNFTNFDPSTKSAKIGTLMGFFRPKQKKHDLKICRGVMCHANEE